MRNTIVFFTLLSAVFAKSLIPGLRHHTDFTNGVSRRCINMWDEGCNNGQLPGAGGDDDYLIDGFNPGKRCINMWDEGCMNDQLPGAGGDDDYLNGGFTPGKRCINLWDEGCINGQIQGAGGDDDYLGGGFNPGKRSIQDLFAKLRKNKNHHN